MFRRDRPFAAAERRTGGYVGAAREARPCRLPSRTILPRTAMGSQTVRARP